MALWAPDLSPQTALNTLHMNERAPAIASPKLPVQENELAAAEQRVESQ